MIKKTIMDETIISREEVLLYFLGVEGTIEELLRSYLMWEIRNHNKTVDAPMPLEHYIKSREDINPALIYLIGIEQDKRCDQVDSWHLMRIPTDCIYTCGINDTVNKNLQDVQGNLSAFALKYAHQYPEFGLHIANDLNCKEPIIIVAEQAKDGKKGNYELLDGAHRLINICRQGGKEISAFVAKMKR